MTQECSECGKPHDDPPRFFLLKRPQRKDRSLIDAAYEYQSMCRTKAQTFIHCEVTVPLIDAPETPLGFVCWVEVNLRDYLRVLTFRQNEASVVLLDDIVPGQLANPVPGVESSFGTSVKFQVVAGDPTPYVTWIEPGTPLARIVETGATRAFHHGLRR
jgi:hypothetical protein